MKLDQQVTSFALSKRLKELGVKQESLFYWCCTYSNGQKRLGFNFNSEYKVKANDISAFTVAELGEMLPKNESIATMIFTNGRCQIAILGDKEYEGVSQWGAAGKSIEADNEADARAKMLIYLLENKLITL